MYRKKPLSNTQNVCLILFSILFFAFGLISIKQVLDSRTEKEEEYKEITLSNESVTKVLPLLDINYNENMDTLVEKIYEESFQVSSLTNKEILYLVLKNNNNTCSEEISLTLDELNELVVSTLNIDKTFTIEEITDIDDLFKIDINNTSITYQYLCPQTIGQNQIITQNIKAEQNNKYLKIYQQVAFEEDSLETEDTYNYYTDIEHSVLIEKLFKENKESVTWDKYPTYVITFLLDEENIKLESVNKE